MTSRRQFLKSLAAASAGIALYNIPKAALAQHGIQKLTILHTNDIHCHIDPFSPTDPTYAGRGGLARLSGLIQQIRLQEENVLLLDSGDMFQGTPYFNYYKGELILKVMSEIGYEASTIGNHEFDNGLDALNKALDHTKFPFINSNYDFSQTKLYDRFNRYVVYRKNGIKIGIYGLGVELQGLVSDDNYEGTIYNDPVIVAREMETYLKQDKKCDLVICLSHLGYQYENDKISDLTLAPQTKYTDLILGGHTHTFLDKPVEVKNADGNRVIINQVGWGGMVLGRLDFYFDTAGKEMTLAYTEQILNQG